MPTHHFLIPFLACVLLAALPAHAQREIRGADPDAPFPEFLPPAERGSGFRPAERFEYHGGWGILSNVARALVTTRVGVEDGREIFQITSFASTRGIVRPIYPADTRTDTVLDVEDWTLLSTRAEGSAGRDPIRSATVIDYSTETISHTDYIEKEKSYSAPLRLSPVLDFMSAVFQIRGLPLEVGRAFPVFVQGGGKFYLAEVTVTGIETIKTAIGKVSCFVLEPNVQKPTGIFARGGGVKMWMTNDANRLLVRGDVDLGFGTARIWLDRYEAPGIAIGKDSAW